MKNHTVIVSQNMWYKYAYDRVTAQVYAINKIDGTSRLIQTAATPKAKNKPDTE